MTRFFYVCTNCKQFTYSDNPSPIVCGDACHTIAMVAQNCYARTARAKRLKLPESMLQRYDALKILPGLAEAARHGSLSFDVANERLTLAIYQAVAKSAGGQTDPSDIFWRQ